jgi:hypothetical protein
MPPHVRSAILLQLPPLAPPALRRRAPTRIPWRMSIRQSTLSVLRPMPHWLLSSTTVATRVSVTVKSAGRSSTPPLKYARSCCRCPLVKRARVGWTRSSTSWMWASALATCRKTSNERIKLTRPTLSALTRYPVRAQLMRRTLGRRKKHGQTNHLHQEPRPKACYRASRRHPPGRRSSPSCSEVGFLWMYRSGWTLATGALVVNVLATLALTVVGVLAFGERLHWTTVAGAAICLVGLGVMSARGGG